MRTAELPTRRRSRGYLRLKRIFDLTVAITALVATLPLLVTVAIAVKLTSPGPVLFVHERVGRYGRHFRMLKFRTMVHGTHDLLHRQPELWAVYVANDHKLPADFARYTPIGRFLRRTSLDELPQLVNVLRGDMSVVGIRPIERTQLELRPSSSQHAYSTLNPGLTGLWQVTGRSAVTGEQRVELDDAYVRTWSIKRDLAILAKTPAAVLRPDSSH